MRITVYINDEDTETINHIKRQQNKSVYLYNLIRNDMTENRPVTLREVREMIMMAQMFQPSPSITQNIVEQTNYDKETLNDIFLLEGDEE